LFYDVVCTMYASAVYIIICLLTINVLCKVFFLVITYFTRLYLLTLQFCKMNSVFEIIFRFPPGYLMLYFKFIKLINLGFKVVLI